MLEKKRRIVKKWKMWKRRERERRKIEGIWTEKIFWSSWEKRVNFKWFDPLSKLKSLKFEFFETLEKTFFRPLEGWRRIEENRTIRILGFFREIPFQWRIHYSDRWLIFKLTQFYFLLTYANSWISLLVSRP